jgi:hypothetical protein
MAVWVQTAVSDRVKRGGIPLEVYIARYWDETRSVELNLTADQANLYSQVVSQAEQVKLIPCTSRSCKLKKKISLKKAWSPTPLIVQQDSAR